MLFIRTAIIVGIGILLVPTDQKEQEVFKARLANASEYAATICDRNPYVCQKGGEYWVLFKKKSEVAGRLAFDLAKERLFGAEQSPGVQPATLKPSTTPALERGTLRPADITPAWRGPKAPAEQRTDLPSVSRTRA